MTGQPRHMSFAESVTQVAIGYGIALGVQAVVFPIFGFDAALHQHMAIAAIFTVISLVRSYSIRRAFDWLGRA